jgi:hypothetical protein
VTRDRFTAAGDKGKSDAQSPEQKLALAQRSRLLASIGHIKS